MSLLLLVITLGLAPTGGVPATQAADDPRAEVGEWQAPCSMPVVGIHAAVLPTGKVLFVSATYPLNSSSSLGLAELWTPPPIGTQECGTFVSKTPSYNFFCSGHSALADGTVLFVGGQSTGYRYGINTATTFDPISETWGERASMAYKRWYPTSTTLPDGRVLALSGESEPNVYIELPEVYNPSTNTWQSLNDAKLKLPNYPRMFVTPSGQVFAAGPMRGTRALDVSRQKWGKTIYTNYPNSRGEGTAVTYGPGKILIVGGSNPATNTAEMIDLNQRNPKWQYTASMTYARRHANATLLPDGKVLVTGGTPQNNDRSTAVLAPELFDPASETWTTLANLQRPRVYHSTAVLLPDGRVMVAGTDGDTTLELYSPPYLFKGPRPSIVSAPSTIAYGSSFEVATDVDPASIASIALIRPSMVTHSLNMDQRYVPLNFTASGGKLSVKAPANGNLAPPGYHMLFIVDNQGRPSIAHFVQLAN